MAMPWLTALRLMKNVLPVVLEKAPDLFTHFDRFRGRPEPTDGALDDPDLAALQDQLDAQQRLITTQADAITRLQARLRDLQRSLNIVWGLLIATTLVAVAMAIVLLTRA